VRGVQVHLQEYSIICIVAEYRFQDYEYKLLDIPLPNGPFLMFEINHVDKNKEKGFYVVELKDKVQIKIVILISIDQGRT
jgi:hypothetical protein